MTVRRRDVYRCEVCGIVAEIRDAGAGEPICCGQPMALQPPNARPDPDGQHALKARTMDEALVVTVGEAVGGHPSGGNHCLQWIEIDRGDGTFLRSDLQPGDPPRADFPAGPCAGVRAYCSRHGLWEN